jgi:hypothetical protein
MTSVNHHYKRPDNLHPAEIGPLLPGDPLKNEHGFWNKYSWNTNSETYSMAHAITLCVFIALLAGIIYAFIRNKTFKFLSFFIYQQHYRRIDIKLTEETANDAMLNNEQNGEETPIH